MYFGKRVDALLYLRIPDYPHPSEAQTDSGIRRHLTYLAAYDNPHTTAGIALGSSLSHLMAVGRPILPVEDWQVRLASSLVICPQSGQ